MSTNTFKHNVVVLDWLFRTGSFRPIRSRLPCFPARGIGPIFFFFFCCRYRFHVFPLLTLLPCRLALGTTFNFTFSRAWHRADIFFCPWYRFHVYPRFAFLTCRPAFGTTCNVFPRFVSLTCHPALGTICNFTFFRVLHRFAFNSSDWFVGYLVCL